MEHGLAGLGAFWCIVEMVYEEAGYCPRAYDRIAFELRIDTNVVRSIVEDFDLFKFDDDAFWSESALERLKQRMDKSAKCRKSVLIRWAKNGRNTNV